MSLDAEVVEIGDLEVIPTIDQARALQMIAAQADSDPSVVKVDRPATLVYYHDERDDRWHLAYQFQNVPVAPKPPEQSGAPPEPGHGSGSSLHHEFPHYNYLVDAHDGHILFAYSAVPGLGSVPTRLQGIDLLGDVQRFWGRVNEGTFVLDDP